MLVFLRLFPDPKALPTANPALERELPMPLGLLRDSLQTFSSVRGGRARASSFVSKSRAATAAAARLTGSASAPARTGTSGNGQLGTTTQGGKSAAASAPPPKRRRDSTASKRAAKEGGAQHVMAMVPAMMAGTIGANWTQGSLEDPAAADPSRSSAALWEGKVQLHPDTDKEDYAYKKWGHSLATPIGDVGTPGTAPAEPSNNSSNDKAKSKQYLDPSDSV